MSDYTCARCGGTFEKVVSDSDAIIEYQDRFTEEMRAIDTEPPVMVCDDCYKRMLREYPPDRWIAEKRHERG